MWADLDVNEVAEFVECANMLAEVLLNGGRKVNRAHFGQGVAFTRTEVDDLTIILVHDAPHRVADRFENTVDVWSIALCHHSREVVNTHAYLPGDKVIRRRIGALCLGPHLSPPLLETLALSGVLWACRWGLSRDHEIDA